MNILSVNDYSDNAVVQKFDIPGPANSISWFDDKMVFFIFFQLKICFFLVNRIK